MSRRDQPATVSSFDRLLPFGRIASFPLILAGSVVSFLLFGFWYPYWRIADMDFMIVYNAWLLNDGFPQAYLDHPGYLSILLLSGWFQLLHTVGALDVYALSGLPAANDPAAFDRAWTAAVRSARVVSLALGLAFITAFYVLLLRLVRDWRVAVLGALALAFSGGLAMHERILRTELLTAGLFTTALLVLLITAQTPNMRWRPLLVGLAALLTTLAAENKVQAILLICALPMMVLPFGQRRDEDGSFWRQSRRAWPAVTAVVLAAAFLAAAAAPLVALALAPGALASVAMQPAFRAPLGTYHAVVTGYILLGILAFSGIWRVGILETVATIAAVIAGCALGLLVLYLSYSSQVVTVVLNPIEKLFEFATWSQIDLRETKTVFTGEMARHLMDGFFSTLARRTFILDTSPRPTIFLEWLVIAMAVIAWRRSEHKLVLQIMVLMTAVWGIDTIGMLRGLKLEYFILTDPLVIIAAALLLARLVDLRNHRWTYPIGATLIAAHFTVSQAEPVKHMFKRSGPEGSCEIHPDYFKRIERFYFCAPYR